MAFGSISFGRIAFGRDSSPDPLIAQHFSFTLPSRASYRTHIRHELPSRAAMYGQIYSTLDSTANLTDHISLDMWSRANTDPSPRLDVRLYSRATLSVPHVKDLHSHAAIEDLPGYAPPVVPDPGENQNNYDRTDLNASRLASFWKNYYAHPKKGDVTGAERIKVVIDYNNGEGKLDLTEFGFSTQANSGWNINFSCNGEGPFDAERPDTVYPMNTYMIHVYIMQEQVTVKGEMDLDTGEFEYQTAWKTYKWNTPQFVIVSKDYELSGSSFSTKYNAVDLASYLLSQDGSDFPTFQKVVYDVNRPGLAENERLYDWKSEEIIDIMSKYRYIPYDEQFLNRALDGALPGREYLVRRGQLEIIPDGGVVIENPPRYKIMEFDAHGGKAIEHIAKLLQPVAHQFKVKNVKRPTISCFPMRSGSGSKFDVNNLRVTSITHRLEASGYKGGFHAIKGAKLQNRFEFVFTKVGFHKVSLGNALANATYRIVNLGGYIDLISSFDSDDPERGGYNGTQLVNSKNAAKIINAGKSGTGITRSLSLAVYPPENPPLDVPIYCKLIVEGIPYDPVAWGYDLKWSFYYPSPTAGRPYRNPIDLSLLPTRSLANDVLYDLWKDLNKGYDTVDINCDYPHLYVEVGSKIEGLSKYNITSSSNWRVESISFSVSGQSVSTNFKLVTF